MHQFYGGDPIPQLKAVALHDFPVPLLNAMEPDPVPERPATGVTGVTLNAIPLNVTPPFPKSARVSQAGPVMPAASGTLMAVPLSVPPTFMNPLMVACDVSRNLSSSVPASGVLDVATHSAPDRVTVTRV